jgi:hypothetical protein
VALPRSWVIELIVSSQMGVKWAVVRYAARDSASIEHHHGLSLHGDLVRTRQAGDA